MKSLTLALIVVALGMVGSQVAQARQYASSGRVVHTRRAPVAMHRALPPFRGVHVYGGR